jgi:hypothetical protein
LDREWVIEEQRLKQGHSLGTCWNSEHWIDGELNYCCDSEIECGLIEDIFWGRADSTCWLSTVVRHKRTIEMPPSFGFRQLKEYESC